MRTPVFCSNKKLIGFGEAQRRKESTVGIFFSSKPNKLADTTHSQPLKPPSMP